MNTIFMFYFYLQITSIYCYMHAEEYLKNPSILIHPPSVLYLNKLS